MSPCTLLLSEFIWLFKVHCCVETVLAFLSLFFFFSLPTNSDPIPLSNIVYVNPGLAIFFLIITLVFLIISFLVAFLDCFAWHPGKQATEHNQRFGPQEASV